MIQIPTLQELYDGIVSDLETRYGVKISTTGKVALRAIAAVQAAKLKLYYLSIGNLQKNIFVDTAESESIGGTLERFGRVKLGRNPFPPVAGVYELLITGTVGATVPAGTTFKSGDSSLSPGFLFILDADYELVSVNDYINVRALTSGETSKLIVGDALTATAPISGVDSGAIVNSVVTPPLAAEDLEAYRLAIINSYRLETQGGSAADYRLWSQDAQGQKAVYPYAKSGAANEINLFVEATVVDSTDGKGTPTAQLLLDVEDVVELDPNTALPILERGRRPLGVFEVHYLPITVKEVDIHIAGAVGFTAEIKAAILTALTDEINLIRPFIAGADVLAEKNNFLDANKIVGIIVQTYPGAVFGAVTFEIDSVLMATFTFLNGDIPNLNSVDYV